MRWLAKHLLLNILQRQCTSSSHSSQLSSSSSSSETPCSGVAVSNIEVTANGKDPNYSTSQSLNFVQNAPFAIPEQVGILSLTVNGLQPDTPQTRSRIKWAVRRNPDDILSGPNPSLTIDPNNPLNATLGSNAQGSFNIIVYCDPNSSNNWEDGKILVVLNIVIVEISVLNNSITPYSTHFTVINNDAIEIFSAGTENSPAIEMSAQVILRGGGGDGLLGLEKFGYLSSGNQIGWLQNVSAYGIYALFPGWKEYYAFSGTTASFPLLDTNRNYPDQGGENVFLVSSVSNALGPSADGGYIFLVQSSDGPNTACRNWYPDSDHNNLATFLGGSQNFNTYLSCWSADFPNSYTIIGNVIWSVTYNFQQTSSDPHNIHWQNTGSQVTANSFNVTGYPMSAAMAGAITVVPTLEDLFVNGNFNAKYEPN